MEIQFEWDIVKAASNKKKHKVSFDEAKTTFFDENAIVIHDPEHSEDEDRFVILGISAADDLLVVCHCFRQRENESVVRIISARKATKKESIHYYGGYDEKRI